MDSPTNEDVREALLRECPELAAHLFDLEQVAEPFFGINDIPYPETFDELGPEL